MKREISATAEMLLADGRFAAGVALREAVETIDLEFGDGFAEKNPALVAAYLQAAVQAGTMGVRNRILENCTEAVTLALDNLATALQGRWDQG